MIVQHFQTYIKINNSNFNTKWYDKRQDFYFNVVTLPNLKSNIPEKPAYCVFKAEVYRICKSSSNISVFINDIKLLIAILIAQNYNKNNLYCNLRRFIKWEPACLLKHWHNFSVADFMQNENFYCFSISEHNN